MKSKVNDQFFLKINTIIILKLNLTLRFSKKAFVFNIDFFSSLIYTLDLIKHYSTIIAKSLFEWLILMRQIKNAFNNK